MNIENIDYGLLSNDDLIIAQMIFSGKYDHLTCKGLRELIESIGLKHNE